MEGSILAQRERVSLGNGMALRLLSALEVLQARREAGELAGEDRERALCSNACLLARALEQEEEHKPVFSDGRAVLAGLTVEEIGGLARRWSQLRRESDPGLNVTEEELENVKKTPERPGRAAAVAGAEGVSRPAHREKSQRDEGSGLSVVSGQRAFGPGGAVGTAVSRLPGEGGAGPVPRVRKARSAWGGREQSRL